MGRTVIGVVISKKTNKTIVVGEQIRATHPLYKKQYTVSKRFMAHDEKNEAGEGDRVVIGETRPISRQKRFNLEQVLQKAPVRHVETTDEEIAEAIGRNKEEKPRGEEE